MTPLLKHIVTWVPAIAAAILVMRQCRKPAGWPGRFFLSVMNLSHARLTNWGLAQLTLEKSFTILDVGCGGGATVRKLAASASDGKVYGIDYSAASVAAAQRTNAFSIAKGRVEIRQASVSELPFPDGTFDVVTAVETHYYWPDLPEDVREILRVLKPGGRLAIIAETYRGRSLDAIYRPAMSLLRARYLTLDEHRDLLVGAGFLDVAVREERSHGWVCAVGRKPSSSNI
ncbi:MAG TPA: class I SAM-dependent methyltransferase [Thermoanaerobaculia bacterium]